MPAAAPGRWPSRLWLWAPALAVMALIFAVSSMSAPPAPPQVNDKVEHFLAYGVLALLVLRATSGGGWAGVSRGALLAAWGVAAVYGVSDEVHQSFVPGRASDPADVVADALGAAVALVAAGAFGIIRRSRRSADAA